MLALGLAGTVGALIAIGSAQAAADPPRKSSSRRSLRFPASHHCDADTSCASTTACAISCSWCRPSRCSAASPAPGCSVGHAHSGQGGGRSHRRVDRRTGACRSATWCVCTPISTRPSTGHRAACAWRTTTTCSTTGGSPSNRPARPCKPKLDEMRSQTAGGPALDCRDLWPAKARRSRTRT